MSIIPIRASLLLLAWMAARVAVGAESTHLVTVFDERFEDNPTPTQRFKILSVFISGAEGSTRYNEARHAYSIVGSLSLVRPVRAGAHVELELALHFLPAGTNAPPSLDTDLMLVLFDRSQAGIEVQRQTQKDAPVSVRFVHKKSGEAPEKVLRGIHLPSAAPVSRSVEL
jgi:hypothetical protein